MPRTIQRPRSGPRPIEAAAAGPASAHKSPVRIRGVTRLPREAMEDVLASLDRLIQHEVSNPRRRSNMRIGRDFVREHGWPDDGYCVRVSDGAVRVMTEDERAALPPSQARADAFVLCALEYD